MGDKVVHVYFGDSTKHPIIGNYLKMGGEVEVLDAPKNIGGRLSRVIFLLKSLFSHERKKTSIFHAHDLLAFYLTKLIFPFSKTIFDSHEIFRGYFKFGYYFVWVLEELASVLSSVRFIPSQERLELYKYKKNSVVIENLYFADREIKVTQKNTKQARRFIYAGLLSEARCISELVEVFSSFKELELHIYGAENEYFKSILEKGLPSNVKYKGFLPT